MSLYSNLLTVLTPYANKIKQNEIDIRTAMSLSGGAPIVVESTSAMTDTEQIYVLSTNGNWYYHNGTAWVSGGEYGAVATDTTLTQSGIPADASVTGEEIGGLHNSIDSILSGNFGTSGIEFEKGGMEGGSNTTYRKDCRLRTKEIAILPYDLTVKIVSANTHIGIYSYEDGVYAQALSYMTQNGASYTIPANTEFRFYVDGRNGLSTSALTVEELLSKFELIVNLMGLKQVTNAISVLNSNVDLIPDYYFENNYLQTKIRDAQLASGVEGISFGFITDIHTGDSSRNSMKLAKYISDRTSALPFMICGGDIPETNTGSENGLYEQAQYWQEMMAQYGKHNVYQCRGNHDYLTKLSGNQNFNAPNGLCFSYVMGNQPYNIHPSAKGKMSYYFDVDTAKIRFIILDEYDVSNTNPDADFSSYVGLSPAQYHWFVEVALHSDGYDIVIVVHQPLNLVDDPSYISNLYLLKDIIAAFNAHEQFSGSWGATTINVDFSTYTSNLICVLSGHKHIDTSGDTGFLNIVTTSDALYTSDGYGRQAGTVSEGAFDIVSIDTNNRIINCTRIGGGYDRQFTY